MQSVDYTRWKLVNHRVQTSPPVECGKKKGWTASALLADIFLSSIFLEGLVNLETSLTTQDNRK